MWVFIVDDDEKIAEIESYALTNAGYMVKTMKREKELFEAIGKEMPDLIILDILIDDENGFDILKKVRQNNKTRYIPVMFVSGRGSEIERVKGLDAGADEYMVKPFGIMEFVSRVNALLRRIKNINMAKEDIIIFDRITVNEKSREVMIDDKVCPLTYKEYELLKYMILNKGIVLSREKMVEKVWGFDYQGESRTVDMHIKSLRRKLGDLGSCIKTVRNVGYKLCCEVYNGKSII